eukprot:675242-Amphidinium_carterae.1
MNADRHFESQLTDAEHGGWLSIQLERFRCAVLSFQVICDSPLLVAESEDAELASWGPRYSIPRPALLKHKVILPHWARVCTLIEGFPTQVACGTMEAESRTIDAWRRISVAFPGSQLDSSGGISSAPMVFDRPARLH